MMMLTMMVMVMMMMVLMMIDDDDDYKSHIKVNAVLNPSIPTLMLPSHF